MAETTGARGPRTASHKGAVRWPRARESGPLKVAEHGTDVGAAVAPAGSGLVSGKEGLDFGTGNSANDGTEEPAQAGGKLQGAEAGGTQGRYRLGDPDDQVNTGTEDERQ